MDKGNLLISANGKGHSAINMWRNFAVIGAVSCVVLGYWLATVYGKYTLFGNTVKTEYYNIYIGCGVLSAVLCFVMVRLANSRIRKTVVNVYENWVEGSSVVPKFPLSFMLYCSISSLQLSDFRLTYDQVSSVDVVNGNTIVINTTNVQHKIYTMNAGKVRDVIMSRKA